eukprot:4905615-Amphidinium_carterae.1
MPLNVPTFMDLPAQWYTDSKSLFDVIKVDTTLEGDVAVAWIDTQLMLADSLTKLEVTDMYFKECVSTGVWSTASTEETLARKAQLQAQCRERKRVAKLSKHEVLCVSPPGRVVTAYWAGRLRASGGLDCPVLAILFPL